MKLWLIRICKKLSKILSFNTKDPYFLSLLNTVTSLLYIYTCEQQSMRNIKLNVIILYNAHLKANDVMDDWNIERSLPSLLKLTTKI